MQPTRHYTRGRGFLLIETAVGMAVLALIFTVLTLAVAHQRRVSHVLADDRAAVRIAERVLAGMPIDEATLANPQISMTVEPLALAAGGDDARPWARVTVTCRTRTRSLVGLMPVASEIESLGSSSEPAVTEGSP